MARWPYNCLQCPDVFWGAERMPMRRGAWEMLQPLMPPHENIRVHLKHHLLKVILTDSHFWLPIAVLILGVAVLMVVR